LEALENGACLLRSIVVIKEICYSVGNHWAFLQNRFLTLYPFP
jgi:hypothetical protein